MSFEEETLKIIKAGRNPFKNETWSYNMEALEKILSGKSPFKNEEDY
jgi:hypothetical protein